MIPKILFKFASRSRPERFFEAMDSIVNNLYDNTNYHISVTMDYDDESMNNEAVINRIATYKNTSIALGYSMSKVDAINRSFPDYPFDIICVHSDDFLWTFYGFDKILRQEFLDDDFDKYIHVPEPDSKHMLATYYIAGKDFFNRFGYIYNPEFKSLWCDNLVMDIAQLLGKYRYVDCPGMLFHKHPSYGHVDFDEQYTAQQALWSEDEKTYYKIKARGYDLHLYKP